MEFHPIAELFPLMESDDLESLALSIKNNGLRNEIVIYDGKILDGRNRYLACQSIGIEPTYKYFAGEDPLSFALDENVERRHLTPSQRACFAVDILPAYEAAAKERSGARTDLLEIIPEGYGNARDIVAEKLHVNSHYVTDAAMVKEEAPELFEEMRSGLIHMKEAIHEVKDRRRKAARAEIAVAGASVPEDDRWHVWQGDIATWQAPRQYDFIITDPPYPREYLQLYITLAKRSAEWLKPGGLLIALSAHYWMNEIYKMMDLYLDYFWTAAYLVPGETAGVFQKHINPQWKPLIMYQRKDAPFAGRGFADVFKSEANDKDHHKWGQSESGMFDIISKICSPGQYILDPFCGAGTTGIAALRHKCLFDGIDIDIENVNISKGRLAGGNNGS